MISINTTNSSQQRFSIIVNANDKKRKLNIELRYRKIVGKWFMSVYDGDVPLVRNSPLLMQILYPVADIFRLFEHKNIGMALIMPNTDDMTTENPDINNLGIGKEFELCWY